MTEEQTKLINRLHGDGVSLRAIAKRLGIGATTVHRAVTAAANPRNAERDAEIVRRRREGQTYTEIANALHCSSGTVQRVLARAGLVQSGLSGHSARSAALAQVDRERAGVNDTDELSDLAKELTEVNARIEKARTEALDAVCQAEKIRNRMRALLAG